MGGGGGRGGRAAAAHRAWEVVINRPTMLELRGVVGLILILTGRKKLKSPIPYGPYIALAALVWLYCGRELVNWYFASLGV